jgi:hypothetical protein
MSIGDTELLIKLYVSSPGPTTTVLVASSVTRATASATSESVTLLTVPPLPRMAQIPINTTIPAILFLTRQAPRSLAHTTCLARPIPRRQHTHGFTSVYGEQ